MSWIVWSSVGFALLGGVLFLDGLRHLWRRRPYRGGGGVVLGILLALAGLSAALVGLNIATYARLTYERPVAEVSVRALDPDPATRRYAVAVRLLDGSARTADCTLQGDEWMLSARVRRWKPWLTVLGLDSGYTLDQVANKYSAASEGEGKPITVCDLSGSRPDVDRYVPHRWLAWLMSLPSAEERRFGSASYMPLIDGAVYTVLMTQSGLNAEPANDIAKAANAGRG
jgi:hypothetical protein